MMHSHCAKTFEGKNVVVTGAAGGIGSVVAKKFAENGAGVALLDMNEEGLRATARDIEALGPAAFPIMTDLASGASIAKAMEEVGNKLGAIHALANCAGIVGACNLIDLDESQWDLVMNVNLKATWLVSRLAARNMIANKVPHGKIVSISSQASKLGEAGNGAYSISKAGVNSLTQVLAQELAGHGIAVSAVCPGYVRTEMMVKVFNERGPLMGMTPEEYEKTLNARVPMGRMAEPDEVAELILFLAGDKAHYITGVTHTIAGGSTLI